MYVAQEGVHVGRPPCAECGVAARLHRDGACPVAARLTDHLDVAVTRLLADPDDFVWRGEVQRLMRHRPSADQDHCAACAALAKGGPR